MHFERARFPWRRSSSAPATASPNVAEATVEDSLQPPVIRVTSCRPAHVAQSPAENAWTELIGSPAFPTGIRIISPGETALNGSKLAKTKKAALRPPVVKRELFAISFSPWFPAFYRAPFPSPAWNGLWRSWVLPSDSHAASPISPGIPRATYHSGTLDGA